MSSISEYDTVYLKDEKWKVEVTSIDRGVIPHRYWFKNPSGNHVYCNRKHICIRKPKPKTF